MKKLLLLIFTISLFSSCATLTNTEGLAILNIQLDNVKLNGVEVAKVGDNMKYEDNNISINFQRETSCISFELLNKTSKSLTLVWDKSSLVDHVMNVEAIIHEGVKLIDRNAAIKDTNIPAKSYLKDFVMPVSIPVFINGIGWRYNTIYTWEYSNKQQALEAIDYLENKPTRLILYFEQDSLPLEYDFTFLLKKYPDAGKTKKEVKHKESKEMYFK